MNELDRALIADREWDQHRSALEKTALDAHVRNIAAEVYRNAGRAIGQLEHSPVAGSAVAGALAGGIAAARKKHDSKGRSRAHRFIRGATGGAVGGGAIGYLARGGVSNLGRYGNDVANAMAEIRGSHAGSPWRQVSHSDLVNAIRRSVTNPDARAGHGVTTSSPFVVAARRDLKAAYRELTRRVRDMTADDPERPAAVARWRELSDELKQDKGGGAGAMSAAQAAALLFGTGAAAGAVHSKMEKESALLTPEMQALVGSGINYLRNNPQKVLGAVGTYGPYVLGGLSGMRGGVMGVMQGMQTASMLASPFERAVNWAGEKLGVPPQQPAATNSPYMRGLNKLDSFFGTNSPQP